LELEGSVAHLQVPTTCPYPTDTYYKQLNHTLNKCRKLVDKQQVKHLTQVKLSPVTHGTLLKIPEG